MKQLLLKKAIKRKIIIERYSDKTAPYNKCLELIIPTDVTATKLEAPPDNNCKNTICDAPPKIMMDIA